MQLRCIFCSSSDSSSSLTNKSQKYSLKLQKYFLVCSQNKTIKITRASVAFDVVLYKVVYSDVSLEGSQENSL